MRPCSLEIVCCPVCHGRLALVGPSDQGSILDGRLRCQTCQRAFPVENGIVQFLRAEDLTGSNKKHARLNDIFSHVYTPIVKLMFALCGGEEKARHECMDRLDLDEQARILEVGIGTGDNLPYLKKRLHGFQLYGVDISRSMLAHCARNLNEWNISAELFLGEAEHLPFRDAAFDVVFHIGAINFFTDKRRAIEEMIRVARPGTKIIIADENERALRLLDKFLLRLWIGKREELVPPIDLIPESMLDVRLDTIWRGYGYCIEFRRPPE